MNDLKVGDIVKWNHASKRILQRGIIMKPADRPSGDKWFRVFSFHSGQTVLKRMDRLTKVEVGGG